MFAIRVISLSLLGVLTWPQGENALTSPVAPSATSDAAVVLSGKITDQDTGAPLQGAQISIEGETRGTLSNRGGEYTLDLEDGWVGRTIAVVVRYIGYATVRKEVTLTRGSNTLDVAMAPNTISLNPLIRAAAREEERGLMAPTAFTVVLAEGQDLAGRFNPNFNTESYALIEENRFLSAATNPLSTFSIDVDRASYANVRRFINDGVRPPIDAVRIEELINYFPYHDPDPVGVEPLQIYTEVAPAPWQPLHRLVRIGLKGRPIDMSAAPASNLVFLLDVSGSMNSPDKLPLLKTAFGMLVDQLRPEDGVAIVVYAGAAGLVLPPTPGSDRETILEAIGSLNAGGSTAGGEGLRLAYEVAAKNHIAGGNNRVILATDGDFNVGVSSDSEMVRLIEEKRQQGTFLTVLGFGVGNLKDSKMEQIADHGNGNFSYIDSALEAKKVLVSEMGGTLVTIAKDVKLQVEFNPTKVAAYRLIGYENRLLAAEDFDDDAKDAGELGAGHSVTALYEVIPVGVDSPVEVRGVDSLRYQATVTRPDVGASDELLFVKLRYKQPDSDTSQLMDHPVMDRRGPASEDFQFASAVAAWGMLLRESEYCSGFTLHEVADMARSARGDDPNGYRSEFVRLVEATEALDLLEREPGQRR